jgi:hypothetical protein
MKAAVVYSFSALIYLTKRRENISVPHLPLFVGNCLHRKTYLSAFIWAGYKSQQTEETHQR